MKMLFNTAFRVLGRQMKPVSKSALRLYSAATQPLTVPEADGSLQVSAKLEKLYTEITSLNMIEVAEFSELLKVRLNIKDIPMGTMVSAPAASQDEEEDVPAAVKTSFTIKLMKFDDKQKVALIKEVKNLLEGMNLVQAKKFVESAPTIIKSDIGKDEAEKLKEAFTKVGAECVID
ncbi:39S ribosomal protein L12, mitochondrial isoform X2 [Adelges cooleyi]|uniref:39S ribosomal protein L12, mitochondrial isoform X2 n=1 Tax=Adelges cooleyi TaxID=133065 RepID=UPI00217FA90D|nr:39S ribosomal protein L12, mitochondrial isoform X2 [Adelges cooleyi]